MCARAGNRANPQAARAKARRRRQTLISASVRGRSRERALPAVGEERKGVGCVVVVDPPRKLWGDPEPAIALVEVAEAGNILVVDREGAHGDDGDCGTTWVRVRLEPVAGGDGPDAARSLGRLGVTEAGVHRVAIRRKPDQDHLGRRGRGSGSVKVASGMPW
uniref:Uncharacterized protein n=1 Tax=uncultured bacterium CBNPD1 BAC clone 1664 TaxID=417310 RepID=B1N6P0_9BACT|nr:hypothetical protein [uncultured bacterium CBNPD1 BAC clone 1664]